MNTNSCKDPEEITSINQWASKDAVRIPSLPVSIGCHIFCPSMWETVINFLSSVVLLFVWQGTARKQSASIQWWNDENRQFCILYQIDWGRGRGEWKKRTEPGWIWLALHYSIHSSSGASEIWKTGIMSLPRLCFSVLPTSVTTFRREPNCFSIVLMEITNSINSKKHDSRHSMESSGVRDRLQ